eukprot:443537_1
MDEVNSLHYDETPKAKFMRYIVWGAVGLFVISVTIIAMVEGFSDTGQQGYAFLGIALFCFTLTTFFMQFKIIQQDLSDSARIPVFMQLALCVFFGIAILITVYSSWHPPELDCYYDDSKTFVRQSGNPKCWTPPSCFHQQSSCVMSLPYGIGDQCATNRPIQNITDGSTHYTCEYTYHPPTPRPTPPTPPPVPPSAPPGNNLHKYNAFEAAETYDTNNKKSIKQNSELLNYLSDYYSQYTNDKEE